MYKDIQDRLEAKYQKGLEEILIDLYITQQLGPSCGAKRLGIPRHVFLHFRNLYDLKRLKHEQSFELTSNP